MLAAAACGEEVPTLLRARDVARMPAPEPDLRIAYGSDSLQYVDLRLPDGDGPFPVAVFIHGGCWLDRFGIDGTSAFQEGLAEEGWAVWAPEFRRLGNDGGGWPGTFLDVGAAIDSLRPAAATHPLDLARVTLVGHSAGGHLALWAAARDRIPEGHPLHAPDPLPVAGVLSLSGVTDLEAALRDRVCGAAAGYLLGGDPEPDTTRYAWASPRRLLPLGVPAALVHGGLDQVVPPVMTLDYVSAAREAGDEALATTVQGAGHFELIAPGSIAWPAVLEALRRLSGSPAREPAPTH